ncbi:MAG: PEP/pyruvate-binding domain-containing protein [Candidatus Wallbacteria bacterium]|nr:PEP/pyruvate-binding domain-containing protein [Candidatus Wallbacteria bacterium]
MLVITLDKISESDLPLVGSKAWNLSRLINSGFPVPAGFCINTEAFLEAAGVAFKAHQKLLDSLDSDWMDHTEELDELRLEIETAPFPERLEREVMAALELLGADSYAVRSSATAEDLSGASFAGQYDTFLKVRKNELIDKIRSCWASLFSERAVSYRVMKKISHLRVAMAVIVQKMVDAKASGVLFTIDPVSGKEQIVIEGSWGSGCAVVSGSIDPDRIVLTKTGGEVIEYHASGAGTKFPAGLAESSLKPALCLDDIQVRKLFEIATKIEIKLGSAQDLEWATTECEVFLLQSRPVTAVSAYDPLEDRQIWTNANTGEVLPDVVTPLTWSLVQDFIQKLFGMILRNIGCSVDTSKIIGLVAGRVYFNINTMASIINSIPGLTRLNLEEVFGGQQERFHQEGLLKLNPADMPAVRFSPIKALLRLPGFLFWMLSQTEKKSVSLLHRINNKFQDLQKLNWPEATDVFLIDFLRNFNSIPYHDTDGIGAALLGMTCFNQLREFCRRFLGDNGVLFNRLLSASGGIQSAESGLALLRLSRIVKKHPELEKELKLVKISETGRIASLSGGAEFLLRFEDFMAKHGHHSRGEIDLHNPRWYEEPEFILDLILSYPQEKNGGFYRKAAREKKKTLIECLEKLRNPVLRQIFRILLHKAGFGLRFRENIKSELVRGVAYTRVAALELGKRLTERKVFTAQDDVFFLFLTELEALVNGTSHLDIAELIRQRRLEYEGNNKLSPPAVVVGRFNPAKMQLGKVPTGRVLKGLVIRPGIVTGKARVILKSDLKERVLPGEILVAPFTDPGWAPYFLNAAGIVMDLGGMLSHGCIVAREYGIPTVVNVGPATRIIKTGQMIRLDADHGIVEILD